MASAKPKSTTKPAPKSAKPTLPPVVQGKPSSKKVLVYKLMEKTGFGKQETLAFYDAFVELFIQELTKKGPGVISLPGLLRARVIKKPATKARNSINPFTKEPMTLPAKPARKAIKLVAAKALKDRLLA